MIERLFTDKIIQRIKFIICGLIVCILLWHGGKTAQFAQAQTATDSLQVATATPTAILAPTSVENETDTNNQNENDIWQVRVVDTIPNAVLGGGSIIRVYVKDRPGEPITLQQDDLVLNNTAGSKSEYGPHAAEFAPVPAGQWLVSVPGLSVGMTLQTNDNTLFILEFSPLPASQATVLAQTEATPTPRGGVIWQGRVISQTVGPSPIGVLLRVRVLGLNGIPIDVATATDFIGQAVTGNKPDDLAFDETEIAGLTPGRYVLTPHSLNTNLIIDTEANTTLFIEFYPLAPLTATLTATPVPTLRPQRATFTPTPNTPLLQTRVTVTPTQTQAASPPSSPSATPVLFWGAFLSQNNNQAYPTDKKLTMIEVVVKDRPNQPINLTNGRGQATSCLTNAQYKCQFFGLSAGVYTIKPVGLDISYQVFVDGLGQAQIIFEGLPLTVLTPTPKPTPILGGGAIPRYQTPTSTSSPTKTSLPTSKPPTNTATATPTQFAFQRATATATAPAVETDLAEAGLATSTPALTWQGQVLGQTSQTGQTLVVSAPILNHLVTLQSEVWQGWGRTGNNPEYGDYAIAFTGLNPGTYEIGLEGLAQLTLDLPTNTSILVQFDLAQNLSLSPTLNISTSTITATATPETAWTAAELINTSGDLPYAGVTSILTIQVGDWGGVKISIGNDGFQTECITGTKPELGPGFCQVGGLSSGTFTIQPEGIPHGYDITLDGAGHATVAFWME